MTCLQLVKTAPRAETVSQFGHLCLRARRAAPRLAAGLDRAETAAEAAERAMRDARVAEDCNALASSYPPLNVKLSCRALLDSRAAVLDCLDAIRGPRGAFLALEAAAGRRRGLRKAGGWDMRRLIGAHGEILDAAALFAGGGGLRWSDFQDVCGTVGIMSKGNGDLIEAWTDKIGLDVPFFLWKIHVTLAEAAGAAEEAASDYRAFCGEFEKFFGPLPETWEAD